MKIGFSSILFIVFLILKLTGFIAWSWWLVTAPLWIPIIVIVLVILITPIFLNKENKLGYNYNLELLITKWTEALDKK